MGKSKVTANRVRELLDYDPVTGAFDWKEPNDRSPREGGKAGKLVGRGKREISIDYRRYPAHRIAWLHHHGEWPSGFLCAVNEDYDDLRIDNFVDQSRGEMARKGGPRRTNTSGYRGVTWAKDKQRWLTYLTHNYKRVHVGYFKTTEEAVAARDKAASNLGLLPAWDKDALQHKAAAASRDARLRVLWRKVQKQTAGITGWATFDSFAADIGDLPPAEGKKLVLIPARVDETIGPGNFQWHEQKSAWDYGTAEGKLAYSRAHRERNRNSYRDKELRKNFGIALIDYQSMLKAQGSVCAICGNPERRIRHGKLTWLAVDHCHTTGVIRGLLCSPCNQAIGLLRDSPEVLRKAAAYLERHAITQPSNGAASPSLPNKGAQGAPWE